MTLPITVNNKLSLPTTEMCSGVCVFPPVAIVWKTIDKREHLDSSNEAHQNLGIHPQQQVLFYYFIKFNIQRAIY